VALLDALIGQIVTIAPYIALFVMFWLYIFARKLPLTASVAFTTVTLMHTMRSNIAKAGWLSKNMTGAMVAFKRLDSFFASSRPLENYPAGPPRIQSATFRRSPKASFLLKDISLDFVEGGLNVVIGPSGSGKTTLMLAILGETCKESGTVTRPKDVGYTSQTAWLQNATIKDNILFSSAFEQVRYDRILDVCCLREDISEFSRGDETKIGENGAILSGGQRARVALARALYSKASLLLLDDIFSALDARTAAALWEQCFCSDLLEGRTTILVTQIPWIASQADLAVELENGMIKNKEQHIGVVRRPVSNLREFQGAAELQPNGDALNDNGKVAAAKTASDDVDDELKAGKTGGRMLCKSSLVSGQPIIENSDSPFSTQIPKLLWQSALCRPLFPHHDPFWRGSDRR
jgi:ABC-type multidrug transport system fused ATPase/permease subunit